MPMEKKPIKHSKFILIALLIGITLFSIFKYALLLKERYDLLNSLSQAKEQVTALEDEKQSISRELESQKEIYQQIDQENVQLKDDLRAREEKLAGLEADLASKQKSIDDLNSFISIFKAENSALRQENDNLKLELGDASKAKDALEVRMNSFAELKKAIRELKMRTHKAKVEISKNMDAQKAIEGNQGFLVKDGKPTYPAKIKIEVTPLPEKE